MNKRERSSLRLITMDLEKNEQLTVSYVERLEQLAYECESVPENQAHLMPKKGLKGAIGVFSYSNWINRHGDIEQRGRSIGLVKGYTHYSTQFLMIKKIIAYLTPYEITPSTLSYHIITEKE